MNHELKPIKIASSHEVQPSKRAPRRNFKFRSLSTFLAIDKMLASSEQFVKDTLYRTDVPNGPNVAADLRDTIPNFLGGLANGGRIAGRLAPGMLNNTDGTYSPVVPLLMGALPLLMVLVYATHGAWAWLAGPVALVAGMAILVVLFLLWHSMEKGFVSTMSLCVLLPAATMGLPQAINSKVPTSIEGLGGIFTSLLSLGGAPLFGLLALGAFWMLMESIVPGAARKVRAKVDVAVLYVMYLVIAFIVSALLDKVVPGQQTVTLFAFIVAGSWPYMLMRKQAKAEALADAYRGTIANMEHTQSKLRANTVARAAQARAALEDTTPIIQFGVAEGVLHKKYDGYAPDPGLPFCMSFKDMGNTLLITGRSGGGKTNLLKNILSQALQNEIGLLLLCGKDELPLEFRGLRGYTIIEPGKGLKVGLIEGLSPEQTITTLFLNANRSGQSNSESGGFFDDSGFEMGVQAAVLLEALIAAEYNELKVLHMGKDFYSPEWVENNRQFRWHLMGIQKILDQAIAAATVDLQKQAQKAATGIDGTHKLASEVIGGIEGAEVGPGEWFKQYVHKLKCFLDPSERSALLENALDYFIRALPNLDERTLSNIQFTVRSWFMPLTLHRDLIEWAETERGIDLMAPLRGGKYGVSLSQHKYGKASKMVKALIKVRVEHGVLSRGITPNWKTDHIGTDIKPQTDVFIVMDEAQDIVDPLDGDYIRKCRAFGGITIFGSQSVENIVEAMGEKSADAFLSNCNNRITLACSDTTAEWFTKEMGKAMVPHFKSSQAGIDYKGICSKVGGSPLLEPDNPNRSYYRQLISKGALRVRLDTAEPGSDGLRGHGQNGFHEREQIERALEIDPIMEFEIVEKPLMSPTEVLSYTSEFGIIAVASVYRGRVPRRDVIRIPEANIRKSLAGHWEDEAQ